MAFLRRAFNERKEDYQKAGVNPTSPEASRGLSAKAEREVLAEYKNVQPQVAMHPEFEVPKEEVEKIVLNLRPEEHDKKIEELIALAKEKGIKNALSVVEKLGDYHITDDFHRFVSEYVKEGFSIAGVIKEGKDKYSQALRMALYEIIIPEDTDTQSKARNLKEIISGMEQFYASLQMPIALEIGNSIGESETSFYVAVPSIKKHQFEKAILAIFHNAKISEKPDDYNIFNQQGVTLGSIAELEKNPIFPLKTYESFDEDPLNSIVQSFSKVNRDCEGAAIQILWTNESGESEYYIKRYKNALDKIINGIAVKDAIDMPETISGDLFKGVKDIFKGSKTPEKLEAPKPIDQIAVEQIKKKIETPIVKCNMRILASAASELEAKEIIESIESSFNQFQNTSGNSIKWKKVRRDNLKELVRNFSFRMWAEEEKLPLSLREITSLLHFHTSGLKSVDNLRQARGSTAAAPNEIPKEGILLGVNKHQNSETEIRMAEEDRLRHFYTIGQTGTGKSTLLKNMIIQDIAAGHGVCMIDPHGFDLLEVMGNIPPSRYEDVIYFDPAYTARPMALNMLEYDEKFPEQKTFVVNELFSIFRKLYGNVPESMGPAFEQYFRNSALLVMEDPASGNTLVDMSRVLSDKNYRALKLSRCKNPLITQFWQNAEKTSGEQGLANYVQYVTNKFDVFLSNEIMRPVIAQEHSAFDFRDIMDNRKILLVNLSKGRLGDINANLIGLILVGKILMAALSRVELFGQDFAPFYLYIDEFQNITTDSIATILSEARKYRLSLNMAHQYVAQLEENIRDAVFGNVGSICSFRVGAEDAEFLEKQFAPTFSANDLMNIDNLNAYLKTLINGKPAKPFNIQTPFAPKGNHDQIDQLRELSYKKYGGNRSDIEALIQGKYKVI